MIWMKKESKQPEVTNGAFISVLIPARNEEIHIVPCIESLMHQTYENYEVLVINDNSSDKTGELLDTLKAKYPDKLQVFSGKELPKGWTGKAFAMQQLCSHAKGEYFILTDADTVHSSKSLSIAMTNMLYHKVDFLSGYIRQQTVSIGEKLTIPLIYILSFFVLPLWVCKWGKSQILAAAIGQYICVKAEPFLKAGAYEQVKHCTTEDIYLARSMKKHGSKTVFIDLTHAATCRMYTSRKTSVNGISKNIFDFLGRNNIILALAVFGILFFLTLPPVITPIWVIYALITRHEFLTLIIPFLVNTAFMWAAWFIVFKSQHFSWALSFAYPILLINLLYIALKSWYLSIRNTGYEWKGRTVR